MCFLAFAQSNRVQHVLSLPAGFGRFVTSTPGISSRQSSARSAWNTKSTSVYSPRRSKLHMAGIDQRKAEKGVRPFDMPFQPEYGPFFAARIHVISIGSVENFCAV